MLVSMTGYGSVSEQISLSRVGTVTVSVEIKTLNGRFFELVSKTPGCLNYLEIAISSLLQEKFIRGRTFLGVRFEDAQKNLETITPSWLVLDQYVTAVKAIKEKYNFTGELGLVDVVSLPNAFASYEGKFSAQDESALLALVAKVADTVARVRLEEGVRLEKDFQKMFASCKEKVGIVEKAFKIALEHQKEVVKHALAEHQGSEQHSQLVEDLQSTLRKMDIHEEVTRFKSHLESVTAFLQTTGIEKGKRLDFILQELMRETNTMMAKCPAYEVSTVCIDIKVELEKAREQIQNIV